MSFSYRPPDMTPGYPPQQGYAPQGGYGAPVPSYAPTGGAVPFQFSPQYMQHYSMWQQPSSQYGNYGSFYQNVFQTHAYQAYNMSGNIELWHVFELEMRKNSVNIRKQAIQSEDLCNILNNTPAMRNYYGIYWSKELCSVMIAMLDRSGDGFMQWEEYMELQQCLVAWIGVFRQTDTNRSGFIEAHELNTVISQLFGYRIQPATLTTCLKRYSRVVDGDRCLIAFDDFVALCVRLRAYTDAFRRRDAQQHPMREEGHCGFTYDDVSTLHYLIVDNYGAKVIN